MLAYVFKASSGAEQALTTYRDGSNLPKCPSGAWVFTETVFDPLSGARFGFADEAIERLKYDGYWVSYRESPSV